MEAFVGTSSRKLSSIPSRPSLSPCNQRTSSFRTPHKPSPVVRSTALVALSTSSTSSFSTFLPSFPLPSSSSTSSAGEPASLLLAFPLPLTSSDNPSSLPGNRLPNPPSMSHPLPDLMRMHGASDDDIWLSIREEVRKYSEEEPTLASYYYSTVLAHRSLERSLAFHLANKLSCSTLLNTQLFSLFADVFLSDSRIGESIRADLRAVYDRDPACQGYSHCLLSFKGFLSCQTHRVAHSLWMQGRQSLAMALSSRVSEIFHVDIHPAAKIGKGILLDHATGIVIGETAEVGDNVSMLHGVTLGGCGVVGNARHPKVRDGAFIGAGSILLGPIIVGAGAKIGACSVVVTDVPTNGTVVGNPARMVGRGGNVGPTANAGLPPNKSATSVDEEELAEARTQADKYFSFVI